MPDVPPTYPLRKAARGYETGDVALSLSVHRKHDLIIRVQE